MANYLKQINEAFDKKHGAILKESANDIKSYKSLGQKLEPAILNQFKTWEDDDGNIVKLQARNGKFYTLDELESMPIDKLYSITKFPKNESLKEEYIPDAKSELFMLLETGQVNAEELAGQLIDFMTEEDAEEVLAIIKSYLEDEDEFLESLQSILRRVNEAPMSDEDRADTELLRNIYKKRIGRKNAALTKQEKAVLDKYGLNVVDLGQGRTRKPELRKGEKTVFPDRGASSLYGRQLKNPEYNIANKARTTGTRDYSQGIYNYGDERYQKEIRHEKNAYGPYGKLYKHGYAPRGWYKDGRAGYYNTYGSKSYKNAERDKQADIMRQDYSDMASVVHRKNRANELIKDNERAIKDLKKSVKDNQQKIDVIKNKYRRG